MANPQSTFNIGLQIAKEDSYSVAPNSSANRFWWQGGRWIPITTTGTPDLTDRQATIFPEGRAGSRARYNRRPVVGRRWSDGDFGFDLTMDFMPLIAYGALGSLSSNAVPSTNGASMLEVEPIPAATSKSVVLANQPGDGGALLQMYVGGTSVGGWVTVTGVDADGFGASETVSFTSAGSLYTRTSFSAIGASSITAWSDNVATISINGFQYHEHTAYVNNTSNPSFSIQRYGDPTAGATSKIRLLPGMVITEFELNTPAEARDGLVTGTVSFEGNPTTTCNASNIPSVSPIRVWPAWVLSVTRAGVSFTKALDFSFKVTAGNRNYRTAAGTQNPQGAVYLSNMVDGSMRLLLDSEEEYNYWRGASSNNFVASWNSPYRLNTNNFQQMVASMNQLYFSDVSQGEDADLQILETDFQNIVDSDNGILKMYFKNNIPGSAYQ
jgi:hypothetical protein